MGCRIEGDRMRIDAPFRIGYDFLMDNSGLDVMEIGRDVPLFEGLLDVCVCSYVVEDGSGSFSTEDGILYDRDGTTLVRFPQGRHANSFEVPDRVRRIGAHAFDSCNIGSVWIPDSVESIGACAFRNSTVDRVRLPSLESIPERCFADTRFLKGLELPRSVTVLGDGAFEHGALIRIDLSNVVEIGDRCFIGSDVSDVVSLSSSKHIGRDAFSLTPLQGIGTFP